MNQNAMNQTAVNQNAINKSDGRPWRVAVVGGGIAGLAAAHRVLELDPAASISLFEAGPRLGGSLHTELVDGFLIEHGADSFITNLPAGVDLCRRLGLAEQLIATNETRRRAFVVRRGRLLPVPEGFTLMAPSRVWPVLATPILSPAGKMRMAWEYFVPRRQSEADESLSSFVRRRLGREVFERLVQPLVAGIYTADPERLSLAATLPRFLEMERTHGSLIRATLRQRGQAAAAQASGARYSLFVTLRDGLSSLVAAIADRLPAGSARTNCAVARIERDEANSTWRLRFAASASTNHGPEETMAQDFDGVVLATSARVAGRLLAAVDAPLSAELSAITYASTAVVSLAFSSRQIVHQLDGFGFVVPAIERRKILSASFSSQKFAGRAPEAQALFRVFIGGACQGELLEQSDTELERIAREELAELLGAGGPPTLARVARWADAMPQYHLGHLERVARIESRVAALPGLALAGNAYRGVGIPQVIASGEAAAERAITHVGERPAAQINSGETVRIVGGPSHATGHK